MSIDILNPGESVVVTIEVQVRGNAQVPFIINNQASIVGGPSSGAQIVSAARLPETGDTLLSQWLPFIVVLDAVLGLGLLWRRRRSMSG